MATRKPRVHTVRTNITNETERDCGYELIVLVEFEAGAYADRIISGTINGETLTIRFQTEAECGAYLHNLAADRIAADAQERDLAVEAVEYQIETFVAEVAAANPDTCACGHQLVGDGCENRQCVNFPPTLATPVTYTFTRDQLTALLTTTINLFTDEAMESPSTALAREYAIDLALMDLEFERDRAVRDGDPAKLQTIPALLPLAPLPPAIYPAADGFTWAGAGRCYPSFLDADAARAEQMAELA